MSCSTHSSFRQSKLGERGNWCVNCKKFDVKCSRLQSTGQHYEEVKRANFQGADTKEQPTWATSQPCPKLPLTSPTKFLNLRRCCSLKAKVLQPPWEHDGDQLVGTVNVVILELVDMNHHSMPHPFLTQTKEENHGSLSEKLSQPTELRLNSNFEEIFHKAKALQTCNRKTNTRKHEFFKDFHNQMNSGKIYNALRGLHQIRRSVLWFKDKIERRCV